MTTTNLCEACHRSTTTFTGAGKPDHNQVTGTCQHCHDGRIAKGKSNGHPNTNGKDCGACHNTRSF
jgi:hypothetical protein